MKRAYKIRRTIVAIIAFIGFVLTISLHPDMHQAVAPPEADNSQNIAVVSGDAATALGELSVKDVRRKQIIHAINLVVGGRHSRDVICVTSY